MPEEIEIINQLHKDVSVLFQQNKKDEEIIAYIMSKGYERNYAEIVLINVQEDFADKKNFKKTFFYGLAFLLLGILISFSSYFFAVSVGAGFYFLYWGLIVTGISIIARAFIIFKK